ncbi:MAG: hypothetical protein DMF56_04150 [Acidobacteria bacterium]|nr:MAG: hypothetical protein DMF56_04150 [Acidobacteriota bacterium]
MTAITNPTREALAGGRVKGAMVRAHLQFVRDRIGEAALERTLAAIPESVAAEVNGILVSSWCKFESLVVLDQTIARVSGREPHMVMRELGRHSAQINLSTLYRAFHRDDIHEFFRHSATLHRQFQDFGDCVYEQLGPASGRMSIRGAKCFSPTYCSSEAGYLEEVIATHGGTSAHVSESACQCANDDHCVFELRWH